MNPGNKEPELGKCGIVDSENKHVCSASQQSKVGKSVEEPMESLRTKPGSTKSGKPFDHVVKARVAKGEYQLQCIAAKILGTARPIEVYRAKRAKNNIIKPWQSNVEDESYCPAHWSDIAIGRGACGFRCRACFLILTHRSFSDPSRHVLYENVGDYENAVRKELKRPGPNLGLGIDCSDSLLYEGETGHARRLIPMFAHKETNPFNRKLILLTKSTNVHYIKGLPTKNILMTFSLNPEQIADLWEGKWNDSVRITPRIEERLAASAQAQAMGFEVRWRIDPILPVDNWADIYRAFLLVAASEGHRPTRITLGTYREMGRSLLTIAAKWGLPPMGFVPGKLSRDGMHYHMPEQQRIDIYGQLVEFVKSAWEGTETTPIVALCKETRSIRQALGIEHSHCNCE